MIQAFISDGRLYTRDQRGGIHEFESPFVQEKIDRAERRNTQGGWKNRGASENPYWNNSVVWGGQATAKTIMSYRFNNVAIADENIIYYTLTNSRISGLFEYNFKEHAETRLFHKNEFQENGFDYSSVRKEFAIGVWAEDQCCYLKLLDARGSGKKNLTAGDSKDSNPCFSRHNANSLLFQSAGIARDEQGFLLAYGPEAIFRLNLEDEQLTEILSDIRYDFVLPKEDKEGCLYCIRRPYKHPQQYSAFGLLLDVVLFPFRFLMAVAGFLDVFTKIFNQQNIKTSGPNVQIPKQEKYIQTLGQTISMTQVQKSARFGKEPTLVPASWELIRIKPGGQQDVLARNVAYYDIDLDGNVIYTTGYKVNSVGAQQHKTEFRFNMIQSICACSPNQISSNSLSTE